MNKRLLSIIFAAVIAMIAVIMIYAYLNREKQKYLIENQETYVVVATQNIPAGETIQPKMVTTKPWAVKYMQPRVLQNPQAAVGKIAKFEIYESELITESRLTVRREVQDSLAVRLPQGKRAYTMKFDNAVESAVANQVKVGDYVDIIGVFPFAQQTPQGQVVKQDISVTLFQKILVMGMQPGESTVFTFALTPEESAILNYARRTGSLRLILRHPLDTNIEKVPMVEENVLWQYILRMMGQQLVQQQQQDKQPEQVDSSAKSYEPSPTLEIYRGSKREEVPLNR